MATLGFGNTNLVNQQRKEMENRARLENTVRAATAGRSMAPTGGLGGGAPIQQPKRDLATTVRAATAGRSVAPTGGFGGGAAIQQAKPDLATTVRAATAGRSLSPQASGGSRAATAGRSMAPQPIRRRRVY